MMDLIPPLTFAANRVVMLHGGASAVALGAAGPVGAVSVSEGPEQTAILVTAHPADHGNGSTAWHHDPRSPCDEAVDGHAMTCLSEARTTAAPWNFRPQ
jgi:hypothetical protein